MTRYFAIVGAMRTGSNLLEKTLGALGDTVCYGEAFNPSFVGGPRKTQILGWDCTRRDADPEGFLEALITAEPGRIPGFRIFDGHSQAVLEHVLADPRCAVIVLRRDPLDSFVSLQIARATDQWMLKNPKRRVSARITFDAAAFERYREGLDAHYDHVAKVLDASGRPALMVDYDALSDTDTIHRAAAHIGSTGTPPAEAPILRQNPGHLWEKVRNYRAMCAALGRAPETPESAEAVGRAGLFVPPDVPLAYAPIAGPCVAPALALLQRIEARDFGQVQRPRGPLLEAIAAGTLFPRGEAGDRPVFALVCHPVLRAQGLFLDTILGTGPDTAAGTAAARLAVEDACPDLRHADRTKADGLPPDLLSRAFHAFLDVLEEAVGAPPALIPAWAAQAEIADAWQSETGLTHLLKIEDFGEAVATLCDAAGVADFPPGQQRAIRDIDRKPGGDPAYLIEAGVGDRIAALWPQDYQQFGYPLGWQGPST